MVISVELPRNFPHDSPVLKCKNERHSYIDSTTHIILKSIHPGLEVWSASNDLGVILSDLCTNIFMQTPPTPLSPGWDSAYRHPLAQPLESIKDNAILNRIIDSSEPVLPGSSSQASPSHHAPAPTQGLTHEDIKAALKSKSVSELTAIGKEPETFLSQWSLLEPLRARTRERVRQHDAWRKLKDEMPKITSELEEVENVNSVMLAHRQELEARKAALNEELNRYSSAYTKKATADALLSSAHNEELFSEDLAAAFVRGQPDPSTGQPIELDSFLKQFMASRLQFRTRIDKRALLLSTPNELQSLSTASSGDSNSLWRSTATSSSTFSSPPPQYLLTRPF